MGFLVLSVHIYLQVVIFEDAIVYLLVLNAAPTERYNPLLINITHYPLMSIGYFYPFRKNSSVNLSPDTYSFLKLDG